MRRFVACAAALALATSMAQAQPGKDKGNGGGNADRAAGAQAKGGGKQEARGQARQAAEPSGKQRGNSGDATQSRGNAKENRGNAKENRGAGGQAEAGRAAAAAKKGQARQAERGQGRVEKTGRGQNQVERRVDRGGDRAFPGGEVVRRNARLDFGESRGLIQGCPPGLAKKNNGCMPPGLARDRDRSLRQLAFGESYYRPNWWGYDNVDGRMFYDDGYLYRLGPQNNVLGFVPLLGGALSVGNVWPSYYEPVQVPDYYVDYYNLGPSDTYRYADDVLYRVDPETSAITAIAALLTGDQIRVGQPMPSGYDVYNVPYAYRDRYYDTRDAHYRYADGYVYQIDPATQLVASAIQLLV